MPDRDRNTEGRARNARPRDSFGRPLPHGSEGVEGVPEDVVLGPEETITQAQQLLDSGRPFHAHEVLEAAWKSADGSERDLWQGLAQLAVGLTHVQRGNAKGAAALLRRGVERAEPFAGSSPYRLDISGLIAHARGLADRIEREGLSVVSETDLRPRLAGTASRGH